MKYFITALFVLIHALYSTKVISEEVPAMSVIDDLGSHQQLGSFLGWDVYLDSYVEADLSGYGFYHLAPMIMGELNKGTVSGGEHSGAISRFGSYVNQIFSTTSINKISKLPEYQLIELFNLAYEVNISKWDNSTDDMGENNHLAKISDLQNELFSTSETIEQYYKNKLNCPVRMSWSRVRDKPIFCLLYTSPSPRDS